MNPVISLSFCRSLGFVWKRGSTTILEITYNYILKRIPGRFFISIPDGQVYFSHQHLLRIPSLPPCRSPFRHRPAGSYASVPLLGDIERAVTTSVFLNVSIFVSAGTYDVFIPLLEAGGQPARARAVPIAFLIFQQSGDDIKDKLTVAVDLIALRFCILSENFIKLIGGCAHITEAWPLRSRDHNRGRHPQSRL